MFAKISVLLVALVAASLSSPTPGGHHSKHVLIHVPYKVHTVHHHHVEKVPIYKTIVKEVPVLKEVHVPIIKEVPVPIYKEVHVPIVKKGWESESHGWY